MDLVVLVVSLGACWHAVWRPAHRRTALLVPPIMFVGTFFSAGPAAPATFVSLFLSATAVAARWWSTTVADNEQDQALVARFLVAPAAVVGLVVLLTGVPMERTLALGTSTAVHLWLLAAAAAAAAAAAGVAVALVVQDHCLRTKRPVPAFLALPSLTAADGAVHAMTGMALVGLTATVLAAVPSAGSSWGGWRWDARTLGALVLCLLYAVGLHMRRIAGWRGRRFAIVALTGFAVLVAVTVTVVLAARGR